MANYKIPVLNAGLTPSRLVASNASKELISTDITAWIAGGDGVTVTDDTDGTVTLSLSAAADGWTPSGETFTYASASTFTVTGDKTAKYSKGTRIKLTDSGAAVVYGTVTGSVYSAVTTVTIASETAIASGVITAPYFSYMHNPVGYKVPGDWYKASVYLGTNQSLPATTITVANLDTVVFNPNGDFDTVNHHYVAPVTGYYFISYIMCYGPQSGGRRCGLVYDDTPTQFVQTWLVPADATNYVLVQGFVTAYIPKGKHVTLRAYQEHTGALSIFAGVNLTAAVFEFTGF